jgi:hypothetical protein
MQSFAITTGGFNLRFVIPMPPFSKKSTVRKTSNIKPDIFNHATFEHFGQSTGPRSAKGKGSAPKKLKRKGDKISEWSRP